MGEYDDKVYRKDSEHRRENILYASLPKYDVIWRIMQRHREEHD